MTIRFASKDMSWTDDMKEHVQEKIVQPLRRHLNNDSFEMFIHFGGRTETK